VLRAQALQLLLARDVDAVHTLDQHLGQVVARLHLRLVQQADQQRETFGRGTVLHLARVERLALGREVADLEWREVFQGAVDVAEGGQPVRVREQVLEVRARGTLGELLEVVVRAVPLRQARVQQRIEASAIVLGEAVGHRSKHPPIDQGAHPLGQAVERRVGRQLAARVDQLLDGDVDQVGWVVHDLRRRVDGPRGDVAGAPPVGVDPQVQADRLVVLVQRARRHLRHNVGGVAERRADLPNDGRRHVV